MMIGRWWASLPDWAKGMIPLVLILAVAFLIEQAILHGLDLSWIPELLRGLVGQ